MRIAVFIGLAAMLTACAGPAPVEEDSSWYIGNERVPDTEWHKTDGPFGAQLFITDDAKSVYDFWENQEGGVPITRLDRAPAGTYLETVVFFIRCAADRAGKCSVRGFVTVTRSDGLVLVQDKELLLSVKPPPEGYSLGISEAGVGLELEDIDGSYLFEITVVDSVANHEVRLSQRVAVGQPIQGGYSTQPIKIPVFDAAQVAVDSAALNNWLNTNYSSLTAETMTGPREHLYYLIDSWVSSLYEREGIVLPSNHDLLLQHLFSWSERLGVFGGNLVYNAIKSEQAPAIPSFMPVPSEFSLSLQNDMLKVQSNRGGWSVSIPYYFMIWNLSEFDATDGPRTQLVSISTAAATHEGLDGHSQATLMLLAGREEDSAKFEAYWRAALGFTGDETIQDLSIDTLKSRARFDPAAGLHSEYTSWQTETGPIVVVYMGMNGTYQSNRPHFLDFIRSLRSIRD